MEQRGLCRFEARVYLLFGIDSVWMQPFRSGLSLVRRALDAANRIGDVAFAGYSHTALAANLLASGEPLADVQCEAEAGIDFARRFRFGIVLDMTALVGYAWPGNIRELQHFIERAVIRSAGERLEVPMGDLPQRSGDAPHASVSRRPLEDGLHRTLKETERAQILATLRETGGVLSGPHGAAQRLGIHRSTLQFRMKKLGIERRPSEYEDRR